MAEDITQILDVVGKYVEGTRMRDETLLRSIFHDAAQMFGNLGERRIAAPIAAYITHAATTDPTEAYQARTVKAEVFGDTAFAVLEERNYQGRNFLDQFTLLKCDGDWRIVGKLFTVFT